MIVIAVPNEAANESGISSFDAGMSRSRERFSVTGSITAVVVTWCVKADNKATEDINTTTIRL